MNIIEAAERFATKAHEGAVDKYTGEPYINHPRGVYEILLTVTSDPETLAAAWCHDVIEDVPEITHEVVAKSLTARVADLVEEVSNISKREDGNRATRKAKDREHLAKASPAGQNIKLADIYKNTSTIIEKDRKFAKTYIAEKLLDLEVLDKADRGLFNEVHTFLKGCARELGISVSQSRQNLG